MPNGKISVRDTSPTYSVPYLIREGDNLTKISKATRIPVEQLAKDNNIKDPNLIYADDILYLKIYGFSIVDISSGSVNRRPDDFRNIGINSTRETYNEINNKGVSVWLQEKSK